ncbi:MAG TPA: hypothetical protein ENK57_21505 [Polyangiaceae bacterium]|nr:hypothetical protein [Polyangiaceae bacterium]
MKKTVTVESNDPETPKLVLTLAGETWTDVVATPNRLSLGEVGMNETATHTLNLAVTNPAEVTIDSVTFDDDRFTIEPAKDGDDGVKRYDVTYRGSSEIGRVNGRVRVTYTAPDGEQHLDVPIWGQIVGNLRYPNSVFMGVRDGAIESRQLFVSTRDGKPVRIVSATDPEGRLEVKLKKPFGPKAELELSWKEEEPPVGAIRGALQLKTTDALQPSVTIPYTIGGSGRGASATRKPRLRIPERGLTPPAAAR